MVEQKAAQFSTPYQFNGKELDSETGLYNYGARYYDPSLSLWLGVDPLADKFAGWSPYNYVMNNPVNMIDPDGRAATTVKPKDVRALNAIRGTLSASDRSFVKLDKNGNINKSILNLRSSNSVNFKKLQTLVNSENIYTYNVSSSFETNKGVVEFGAIKRDANGNASKRNFKGVNTIPGAEFDGSVDDNVNVYSNSGLEGLELLLNAAHEIYGHTYLLELQKQGQDVDYLHKRETKLIYDADGNIDGLGAVETNTRLIEEIKISEKEVLNNNDEKER